MPGRKIQVTLFCRQQFTFDADAPVWGIFEEGGLQTRAARFLQIGDWFLTKGGADDGFAHFQRIISTELSGDPGPVGGALAEVHP